MFTINAIVSLAVGIPAITGWVRYRRIQPAFYPFICWLSFGFINEITSIWAIYQYKTSNINNNVYIALSPVCIIYQLHRWNRSAISLMVLYGVTLFSVILFGMEWWFRGSTREFFSYLLICNSAIIVLGCSQYFSKQLTNSINYLHKDASSLISIGVIIIYTYLMVTEYFLVSARAASAALQIYIPLTFSVINFLVNLLFIIAVLCIPLKIRYFLRQSSPR